MAQWVTRAQLNAAVQDALELATLAPAMTLTSAQNEVQIDGAVEEYSSDRPRERVHRITGDGTVRRWILATEIGTSWQDGFSTLQQLRKRLIADANDEGRLVEPEDWTMVVEEDGDGVPQEILILGTAPSADDYLYLTYTTIHVLDDGPTPDVNTIPLRDREALFWLSNAHACMWLAQKASDTLDATIEADAVNWNSVAGQFRSQSKRWREMYERHVLGADKPSPAAGSRQRVEDKDARHTRATHFTRSRHI